MEMNTLTLILAIIAVVPTVGGILIQYMKDRNQAKIDERKQDTQEEVDKANATASVLNANAGASSAAASAQAAVIATLQDQVERQSKRIAELEEVIIDKTTKIGELMIAKIDAESDSATMRCEMKAMQLKMSAMQLRLNAFLPEDQQHLKKEDTLPLSIKKTLRENESKKADVIKEIGAEIQNLKSGSITNGSTHAPIEGE